MILALIAFGAAVVSRADAGLIPVRVEQSPFEVDVLLEWTEEGTEEPLVVLGLHDPGDWQVQVQVVDNTATADEWVVDILVFHRSDPHGGSRSGASGGVLATFDDALFGQVLDVDRFVFHLVIVPNEGDPTRPLPHLDRLQLQVYRDPISDAANPSTIHLRSRHVTEIPEPGSISLLLIALISVGLVHRRIRGRVTVRGKQRRQEPPSVSVMRVNKRFLTPLCLSPLLLLNVFFLFALLMAHRVQATEYKFTTIDFPGATSTVANGLNNKGVLVGSYVIGTTPRGFRFDGESFSLIDFPQAGVDVTVPHGINDGGMIVGSYGAGNVLLDSHGFMFDGDTYTTIDFPDSDSSGVGGINSRGDVVGGFRALDGTSHGFLFDGASYTVIDFPGAARTGLSAINDDGLIVGNYSLTNDTINNATGFLLDGASFTEISFPGAVTTSVVDMNNLGHVVGWSMEGGLFGGSHGFVFDGVTFLTTDAIGGSPPFYVTGINDGGSIVGYFRDSLDVTHGFIANPVPEPSTFLLMSIACVIAVLWRLGHRRRCSMNVYRWRTEP